MDGARELGCSVRTVWRDSRALFGQWTHVGKGATFGPGRYRLEPAEGEARG